jgi:hypothetical protein
MQAKTSLTANAKNAILVQVWVDADALRAFDFTCFLVERSRSQMLRALMRHAVATKASDLNLSDSASASFEMLDFDVARKWLASYFNGHLISVDTLERRIEDGTLICWKESENRTARRWILKASLVRWMAKLGKELQEEAK